MAKGIISKLEEVRKTVHERIVGYPHRFVGAFAGEGYMNGYRDALDDVLVVLRDKTPSRWAIHFGIDDNDSD